MTHYDRYDKIWPKGPYFMVNDPKNVFSRQIQPRFFLFFFQFSDNHGQNILAHCKNGVKYARFVKSGQFSPFLAISFVFYPIDNARRADLYIN